MDGRFEWNNEKAQRNIAKHGVSFDEARTVFDNPFALIFDDEAHSNGETREIIIGHSNQGRLILVSFAERRTRIRIISARMATRREQKDYEENVGF
ncbi:MAG: BrnT family toxin [Chloroflexi bacterium]|nr:BrnT family toxin [Chloroflexota bacterium]